MSHRFVFDPATAARVLKRALVGAALVAAGYLAALLAPIPIAILDASGIGSPPDAAAAPSAFEHRPPREGAVAANRAPRDFDYFPDHYTNRARDVAEQPPTF